MLYYVGDFNRGALIQGTTLTMKPVSKGNGPVLF